MWVSWVSKEGIRLGQNKKVKKNAICPCGSGKKFKYCCGLLSNVVPFCDRKSFKRAHTLWERLDAFSGHPKLSAYREKAWAFFHRECLHGVGTVHEEDRQAFLDWFIMDYPMEEGRRVLHYYAEENPPSFEEERMLQDWCNSPLSLYRVLEVRPGRGLLMDDLLRHGEYELLNENIALRVEPWSLLVTRLLPVGEYYGYAGVLISIPPVLQNEMLQELDSNLKRFSSREKPPHRGHPAWPEFLLEHGYILFSVVRSLRLYWEKSDNFINYERNYPEESFSPETDDLLQALFVNRSCREWIHTPVPEFQGKTPFHLRMDEEGSKILEKLLNELEYNQSQAVRQHIEPLDVKALRQSLLLENFSTLFRASDWDWEISIYRDVACLLEEISEVMEFTPRQLSNALKLWHDFVEEENPLLKKPEAWAGSVAYLISSLDFGEYTQKDLATYFNVSSGAISSNSIRIKRALDLEQQHGRYRSIRCQAQ